MPGATYLLDVTRLTSRLGRGALTGIDRVELAYLQHFSGMDCALFGVVRTGFGYFLLDKRGCNQLMAYALGTIRLPPMPIWARPWAKPQLRGALALRQACAMRARHARLPSLLGAVPSGAVYLNVGHSNLTESMILAVKSAGMRAAVLIHDTIPLDMPQFARTGSIAPFRAKLSATARLADLVIHTSQDARHKTEVHFANFGRLPPGVTAHLGVTLAPPTPAPLHPARPYFMALGTIEPRKNLRLLLDIWQNMGPDDPQLVIIGAKGWADAALFDQMAGLQATGRVLHGENLPDGAVASLLIGAIALLFPSHAEGFGLPPIEAAGHGVPVIAANLPVLREICGNFPVYLDPTDSYSWMETIHRFAHSGQANRQKQTVPNWADHFKAVLTQFE